MVTEFALTRYGLFSKFFRPILFRSPFSLHNYLESILTFHLYNHWSLFGYLSYQGFVGGGKTCCKLWGYCSGVILPLMWPAKLMQCIKCGGDEYFAWKLPLFLICTSLLHFSVFCLLVQVACLNPSKDCLFLELLRWSTSLVSRPGLLSINWAELMRSWAFLLLESDALGNIPCSNLNHPTFLCATIFFFKR